MKQLTYKKLSEIVIEVNLKNGYSIIAMGSFNRELKKYRITYYVKEISVGNLEPAESLDGDMIEATYKTVEPILVKRIEVLLSNKAFDHSIHRYEYGQRCFDKGNEFFENKRIGGK